MTAKSVVILATATVIIVLAATGIYYFVLPHGPSTTVTIVATGGRFNYTFTNANFTFREGERVELVFVNRGSAPHELQIPNLGVSTGIVDAGATTTVSFTADKVGTFTAWQPCSADPYPQPPCNSAGFVTVLGN